MLTVGLMTIFPAVIHALGGSGAGGRWLPIFYAPLAAALLFHPAVALAASLAAPFLNHLLTSFPDLPTAAVLSLELFVFALTMQLIRRRSPHLLVAADRKSVV